MTNTSTGREKRYEPVTMTRLERLDRDLTSGGKDGQYLYATRGDIRIKVYVTTSRWNGYRATAYFNGRQMTEQASMPSTAVEKLLSNFKYQIEWAGVKA